MNNTIHDPAQLGKHIRKKRRERGLSQSALAVAAGTGLNFIYQLESGKTTCEYGKVLAVIKALGLELTVRDSLWTESSR